MNTEPLTQSDRIYLLQLARAAALAAASGAEPPAINPADLSAALRADGAAFVTLTRADGSLRGCIGTLEAYQPLVLDVRERAAAAAVDDPRFAPVTPGELPSLHIEISRLTAPQDLAYTAPEQLPGLLRPGVDGVILHDGRARATFLPQVWDQLASPERFLSQLCQKMGRPADLWRRQMLRVQIYQVEEFSETG